MGGDAIKFCIQKQKRLVDLRRFLGKLPEKTLDIGQPNYAGRALGVMHNTLATDFNFVILAPEKDYDAVLCFEVIEHVMNPFDMLRAIRGFLRPGGKLYLSTPVMFPWYQGPHHFTEYKVKNFRVMLEYAGFKILRSEITKPWPWWFMFWGFRPFFRVMFHRTQLYECEKI